MELILDRGTVVDHRYEIIEQVGRGGMGTVYKARQEGLGRIVALKVLQSGLADDAESWSRFEREAIALAKLSHRNIATFYSYGVWQDRVPYIAMEFLDGLSLAETLATRQRLEWKQSLQLLLQVCDAMNYAHLAGVVHRDLKSSNIVLLSSSTDEQLVKVMDFGLAKLIHPDGKEAQKLTQTGMLVGSVQYLSPEQCRGQKADHRSDIYATGCVLYECLTGAPPFSADNPIAIIHKHANEEATAPSSRIADPLPPALDDLVLKTLAKDPAARYQSMSELTKDIQEILAGNAIQNQNRDTGKRPPANPKELQSASRNKGKIALLASAIIAGSLVLFAMNLTRHSGKRIDPLNAKNNYLAAESQFKAGQSACGEMDNLEAIDHFKQCIALLADSRLAKEYQLKNRALEQLGNCYSNVNSLKESEATFLKQARFLEAEFEQTGIRHLDRRTAVISLLQSYASLTNLYIKAKRLDEAEKYASKYYHLSKRNLKIFPMGKVSHLAVKSNIQKERGDFGKAIALAEEARQECQQNPSLYNPKYYLDNLFHLIRLHIDAKSSPAVIDEMKRDYLKGLEIYPPQYLSEVGFQLHVMSEMLGRGRNFIGPEGTTFWSQGRQILLTRKLWIFANELSYSSALFRPFLELGEKIDPLAAESSRAEFVELLKNGEISEKMLDDNGVTSLQGIGRWLSRNRGPEASLSFLSQVKSVLESRNLHVPKFQFQLLTEMVMIGALADRPDDFPARLELQEVLRTKPKLTAEQKGCALCALADWEFSKKRYSSAKQTFEEAAKKLRNGKAVSRSDAETFAYVQIARMNDLQKNHSEAELYYRRALDSIKNRRVGDSKAYAHWLKCCEEIADGTAPNVHTKLFEQLRREQNN